MKKYLSLSALLLILSTSVAIAQTLQKGRVVEYNEENTPIPLNNVEIVVTNAGSTVSDADGYFELRFRQLKPGDHVTVRRISKVGYEIFNQEAVAQWCVSGGENVFVIEMCKTSFLQEARRNLIGMASEKLDLKMEEDKKQLHIQRYQRVIDDEEYAVKLRQLELAYEEKLNNIDNYIDRFVRINMRDLDEQEKVIIEMVKKGEFEAAIELYDQAELITRYTQQQHNVDELEDASEKIEEKISEMEAARTQLRQSVHRQVDLLRMQGGKEANLRALGLLHDLAMADSTHTMSVLLYAREQMGQSRFQSARETYDMIARMAAANQDSLELLRAECYRAKATLLLGRITEGITQFEHSLPLFDSVRLCQRDTLTPLFDEEDFYLTLGVRYALQKRFELARVAFAKGMSCLHSLRREMSMLELESVYAIYLVQSAAHMSLSDYKDDYAGQIREGITIMEKLYKEKPYYYEGRLAFAYGNLGLVCGGKEVPEYEEAIAAFEDALFHYRNAVERNPAAYNRFYANCLNNLGETYCKQGNYEKALEYLEMAKVRWDTEPMCKSKFTHQLASLHYNLGKCYYLLKKMDKALYYDETSLDEIEPLYVAEPDTYRTRMGTCLLHLCNTHIALGNYEQAYSFAKRAMEVDPTYPETQERYEMLKTKLKKP